MESALAVEPVVVVDLLAIVVELVVVVVAWQPVAQGRQERVLAASNCRRSWSKRTPRKWQESNPKTCPWAPR